MGGEPTGEGFIDSKHLIKVVKEDFELTIDIEKILRDLDRDGSGRIDYDEFRTLLSVTDLLKR